MEITRLGSQPSGKGPEDWFTRDQFESIRFSNLHGASAKVAMSHIATQEQLNG